MDTPPVKPFVIGFRGLAGAGKTTLANHLHSLLRDSVIRPFAGPLKHVVEHSLGFDKETHPDLYRVCCQALGHGARTVDPNIWVTHWKKGLATIADAYFPGCGPRWIFVDDVRYPNEADCCDLLFFIHRPNNPQRLLTHESESWNAAGYDPGVDHDSLVNTGDTPGLLVMAQRVLLQINVLHANPKPPCT